MGRLGKIARLPQEVREQLNRRLENNETGESLLGWLNELPEVKELLAQEFDGAAINDPNLSAWRTGGFQAWQRQQESLAMAGEVSEYGTALLKAAEGPVTDALAVWLSARYLEVTRNMEGPATDEKQAWKRMREFCKDVSRLRRGDFHMERLRLEREKFEDAKRTLLDRALDKIASEIKACPAALAAFEKSVELVNANLKREGREYPTK
jgi:hypothetical protein